MGQPATSEAGLGGESDFPKISAMPLTKTRNFIVEREDVEEEEEEDQQGSSSCRENVTSPS
jgi:hypothetical protein